MDDTSGAFGGRKLGRLLVLFRFQKRNTDQPMSAICADNASPHKDTHAHIHTFTSHQAPLRG